VKFHINEKANKKGQKELEITLLNLKSSSPNLKYNIEDEGGTVRFNDLCIRLENSGYPISKIKKDNGIGIIIPFPFVYIYGRSDGTISLNGAMIAPSEIYEALLSDPELADSVDTFKLYTGPDADQFIRLFITLAARKDVAITESLTEKCRIVILTHLLKGNECFRSAYNENPGHAKPIIDLIGHGTGIFADDKRNIKHQYFTPSQIIDG